MSRFSKEPCWLAAHHPHVSSAPAFLRPWLRDNTSLTKQLKQVSQSDFYVQVVDEGWRCPQLSEARLLNISWRRYAWVREVLLHCEGKPTVYGRTVIPVTSLRGGLQALARLGTRPLGAAIFQDPGLHRDIVEIAPWRGALHLPAIDAELTPLWGRRSLFHVYEQPLMVAETFLSSIEDYAHPGNRF